LLHWDDEITENLGDDLRLPKWYNPREGLVEGWYYSKLNGEGQTIISYPIIGKENSRARVYIEAHQEGLGDDCWVYDHFAVILGNGKEIVLVNNPYSRLNFLEVFRETFTGFNQKKDKYPEIKPV